MRRYQSLNGTPVGFMPDAARQLMEATKRLEAQVYQQPKWNSETVYVGGGGVIEAIVTSPITVFSGNTYGIGTAQPYIPVFNSNTNTYRAVSDPSFVNGVTVLNFSENSGTVNTGTHIGITPRAGVMELVWLDC